MNCLVQGGPFCDLLLSAGLELFWSRVRPGASIPMKRFDYATLSPSCAVDSLGFHIMHMLALPEDIKNDLTLRDEP